MVDVRTPEGYLRIPDGALQEGNVQTTFVFQPGGVAAANVYTDWLALMADLLQVAGPKIVQLDDRFGAIVFPPDAATYDVRDVLFMGNMLAGVPTTAVVSDGATFTNIERLQWTSWSYTSAVPCMVAPSGLSYFRMWGSTIQNLGAAPFFDVTTPGAALLTQFENASGFNPFPGTPVADCGATGFFSFSLDEAASNGLDTLSGTPGSVVTVAVRDPSSRFTPIAGPFTGLVLPSFVSIAENVDYAVVAPNWIVPDPANTQEAIERMAALLVVLNAGPIP